MPPPPPPHPELDPSLLAAVFHNAVDGIFLADADSGLILHANPAAGRLLGRDHRELPGLHQTALHPPGESDRYAEMFAAHVQTAAAARPVFVESLVRHADGRDIPVTINTTLWQSGGQRIVQGIFRDISAQQAATRALDHERSRLLALLRAIPDLVWLKDPAGRYRACNPAFERLYGQPESKLIGHTDFDFVDSTTAEFFRDHDRRAAEAGRPTRNEEWLTFTDGGYRGLFETVKTPMRDSQGGLIGVLGVARDITEVRRAQGRLRGSRDEELAQARGLQATVSGLESERNLFIAGPVVAFRWRATEGWPVEYVSANVVGVLGYGAEEFLSGTQRYADLIHPDDLDRVREEVQKASAGPTAFFEHRPYRLRHRDGRLLWLHDFTRILRDNEGRPTHYYGYVLDISERIGMQEHLRAESDFREALIESATEGICAGYMCDEAPYVRMTVWNRRLRELTGYTQYDINHLGWYQALFPEATLRERAIARARRAVAGEHLHGEEWTITTRDGRQRTLRVSTAAIPGSGLEGRSSMLGVMEDVTGQRQLEETLRQAQRLEALGTLVGGIAHDFNNFLAGMLGNLHLAMQVLGDGSAAAEATAVANARERLGSVEQLGTQAAVMIERLLAFGRRDRPQLHPVDLAVFVRATLDHARAALPEGCLLEVDVPAAPVVVAADETQMRQVLLNLLANAGDAMHGRMAPRLTVSLDATTLDPQFRQAHGGLPSGHYARLIVADNGPGIAAADLPHVFEPFFTTKAVGQGSGLGLPMVYGIVAGHGGCVHIENRPGLGASVILHLPLTGAVPRTKPTVAPDAVPRGDGQLVLVADDEPFMRTLVRDLLSSLGYRTVLAANGEDAVALLAQHPEKVDIALLDVSMPRLGGPEAACRMRQLRPGLPVLFMTGYDLESALAGEAAKSGDLVLGKPFRVAALAQALQRALRTAGDSAGDDS
ncbi:MAG: PAS domain S-box protein [bacterium]|nr:PAS domain S-box protein [bacterium]